MNVPADCLLELAFAAGAPTTLRAEGVIRHATDKLQDAKRLNVQELREAAEYALRYLTYPELYDHSGAVERLRAALKGA